MAFQFVGGPYDGMEIDPTLVNRHGSVVPVTGDLGTRLFVLMPPREDWDRLTRGEQVEPKPLYPYERVFGENGAWFQEAAPGALDRALTESRLQVHSRARPALAALSQGDRRLVIEAASALQESAPDRWPKDRVVRITDTEPVYLLRVSPDLRAFIRVTESGRIELSDLVREDTLQMFRERQRPAGSPR
jgi:hypothetical protein